MSLLSIKNLSFSYDDDFSVNLKELSLDNGTTAAIVGVSGSGKSTLLECIGLLNHNFLKDEFILDNEEVNLENKKELDLLRVSKIGFMPQNSALLPFLSVYDNILYQIKLVHVNISNKEALAYIDDLKEYIDRLSITNLLHKYPHEISIGQRQRCSFIKALCAKPKLLLIDEPTSALDRKNAKLMFSLIEEIVKSMGIASLIVTHDLNGVANLRQYVQKDVDGISVFEEAHL